MSENGGNGESLLGKVIFWAIAIVVGFVVLRVVFAALGLAAFMAFRLLPIVIAGWVLYRIWKWIAEKPASTD